jgi:ATP-dependent Clp protease ATP-binding subunit ClpB
VDEIIVFHALSEEHLMQIVDIQLERLKARLDERHIDIELTPEARRHLVRIGYDSAFGARPLKRAIQKTIETPLGRMLLDGSVRDGQKLLVDYDRAEDKLVFQARTVVQTEAAGAARS